jgi:hypothetical protein
VTSLRGERRERGGEEIERESDRRDVKRTPSKDAIAI